MWTQRLIPGTAAKPRACTKQMGWARLKSTLQTTLGTWTLVLYCGKPCMLSELKVARNTPWYSGWPTGKKRALGDQKWPCLAWAMVRWPCVQPAVDKWAGQHDTTALLTAHTVRPTASCGGYMQRALFDTTLGCSILVYLKLGKLVFSHNY